MWQISFCTDLNKFKGEFMNVSFTGMKDIVLHESVKPYELTAEQAKRLKDLNLEPPSFETIRKEIVIKLTDQIDPDLSDFRKMLTKYEAALPGDSIVFTIETLEPLPYQKASLSNFYIKSPPRFHINSKPIDVSQETLPLLKKIHSLLAKISKAEGKIMNMERDPLKFQKVITGAGKMGKKLADSISKCLLN